LSCLRVLRKLTYKRKRMPSPRCAGGKKGGEGGCGGARTLRNGSIRNCLLQNKRRGFFRKQGDIAEVSFFFLWSVIGIRLGNLQRTDLLVGGNGGPGKKPPTGRLTNGGGLTFDGRTLQRGLIEGKPAYGSRMAKDDQGRSSSREERRLKTFLN